MKRSTPILVIVLGCLGLAAWLVYRAQHRDERMIVRALEQLREAAEFNGVQKPVAAATASKRFGSFFTRQVDWRGARLPQPISHRSDLEALMFQMRSHFDRLEVRLRDVEVILGASPTNATTTLAARVRLHGMGEREQHWDELEVNWVKTDDGWKVSGARGLQAIRMP